MDTLIMYSSHGHVVVNKATGDVISLHPNDIDEDEYWFNLIVRVNIEEYRNTYGEVPGEGDILDFGLFYSNGHYCPPDNIWRREFKQYSRYSKKTIYGI